MNTTEETTGHLKTAPMKAENLPIKGFSKLSKLEKIDLIVENFLSGSESSKAELKKFWMKDETLQKTIDEFSENTLTNFIFPMGVVPNVLINGKLFCVPMVIEESSVVAASAKAANFWLTRGGFKAEVLGIKKIGQVHFIWNGETPKLEALFKANKEKLLAAVAPLAANMQKRGGGVLDLRLVDRTNDEPGYFQLLGEFDTRDAMGANFINSILEKLGSTWKEIVLSAENFTDKEREVQIVMAILSNYTPECIVRSSVECKIEDLNEPGLK